MDDGGMGNSECAIKIQGLTKQYGNKFALKDVSLEIEKGRRYAIFGPNGAGKTTLIKSIATLIKPTAGSIQINGADISRSKSKIRQSIGLVSHNPYLYANLTLYENLKFYGMMYGIPDLNQRILEVAGQLRLESRLYDRTGTLSRGLQQRATIARAVIHKPLIILLDEPEVGLDPEAIMMMRDVMNIFSAEERTVVMTTHNLERGFDLCDQIVILNEGKIAFQSARTELQIQNFSEIYARHTTSRK